MTSSFWMKDTYAKKIPDLDTLTNAVKTTINETKLDELKPFDPPSGVKVELGIVADKLEPLGSAADDSIETFAFGRPSGVVTEPNPFVFAVPIKAIEFPGGCTSVKPTTVKVKLNSTLEPQETADTTAAADRVDHLQSENTDHAINVIKEVRAIGGVVDEGARESTAAANDDFASLIDPVDSIFKFGSKVLLLDEPLSEPDVELLSVLKSHVFTLKQHNHEFETQKFFNSENDDSFLSENKKEILNSSTEISAPWTSFHEVAFIFAENNKNSVIKGPCYLEEMNLAPFSGDEHREISEIMTYDADDIMSKSVAENIIDLWVSEWL